MLLRDNQGHDLRDAHRLGREAAALLYPMAQWDVVRALLGEVWDAHGAQRLPWCVVVFAAEAGWREGAARHRDTP